MAQPSAAPPSRHPTPSSASHDPLSSVPSTSTSKLNPASASFAFLQPDSVHHQHSYSNYPDYPISSNGGAGGAIYPSAYHHYSPYPITNSPQPNGIAQHSYHQNGHGHAGAGGAGQGWAAGKAQPPLPWAASPYQQQQQQQQYGHGHHNHNHHAVHHQQQQPFYSQHPPPPPPAQTRIPHPPVPPGGAQAANGTSAGTPYANGATGGVMFPLQHGGPPHFVAATGYPGAGSFSPVAAHQHLHQHQRPPLLHHQHSQPHLQHSASGLLPAFSPSPMPNPLSRTLSPAAPAPPSIPAPQLTPAPSLPLSPATPFPPPSTSPYPPSASSSAGPSRNASISSPPPSAAHLSFTQNPLSPSSLAAASSAPPPQPVSSAPTADAPPSRAPRSSLRRTAKLHLPPPRDAPAVMVKKELLSKWTAELKSPEEYLKVSRERVAREKKESRVDEPKEAEKVAVDGKKEEKKEVVEEAEEPKTPRAAPRTAPAAPAPAVTITTAETAQTAEPSTPKASAAPSAAIPSNPAAAPSAPTPTLPSVPSTPKSPLSAASTDAPAPATPSTPAAPFVKRSWADLVRPANAPSSPSSSTSALPNGSTPSSSLPSSLSALLSAPLTHLHPSPPPVPRGLVNNGNLCFANAVLQVLVWTGAFAGVLERVEKGSRKDLRAEGAKGEGKEKRLVEAMIAFLAEFRSTASSGSSVSPAFDPSSANPSASSSSSSSTPAASTSSSTNLTANNNVHPSSSSSSRSSATTLPFPSLPPLSPTPIHDALRPNPRFDAMRRGTQEDAEEFLGFFLETISEEIGAMVEEEEERLSGKVNAANTKGKGKGKEQDGGEGEGWNEVGSKGKAVATRTTEHKESPITRIFDGKLRSVVRCPGQKDSITIEPFQRFGLEIQPDHVHTVSDALLHSTTPESLPDYTTSRGTVTQSATKQVLLDALPPVLILHLKRFGYDEIGGTTKSIKRVGYETVLEVDGKAMSGPLRAKVGERGAKYELFGVVYHHGLQASGGHYTVAVRCGYHSSTWIEMDDTNIYPLSESDVAVQVGKRGWERAGGGVAREDDEQKNAYLLLYARC
ncbi:hypothetical protein JCM8547_005682 [Rhodosporidiobolus lusitaniae]